MEIAPPPLNVLCELCKADFPEGQPWKCFAAGTESEDAPFRSSSIKQIRESVALGCHACSIIWNSLQTWGSKDEKLKDKDTYYLHTHQYVSCRDPGSSIRDKLELAAVIPSRDLIAPRLYLSRVNNIRKRVNEEEIIWDIELAGDTNRSIGNSASQCSSLVNVGQRTITQIGKWLQVCENNHERCRNRAEALPLSGTHGFRLINVGDGNITPVNLVNTDYLRPLPRYNTLSHRWTEATKLTQLTWMNLVRHFASIDTSQWPQLYKDAVAVTRQLRIQYLWIDSICIIQDTREDLVQQDWDEQSVLMDQIYANSVLNLGSIKEKDEEGFKTTRNVLSEFPCVLRGNVGRDGFTTSSYLLYASEVDRDAVGQAPLLKRGWIYQERMLSKRVVHFGRQTYWECASLFANEAFLSGYSIDTEGSYTAVMSLSIKADLWWDVGLQHSRTDQTPLSHLWLLIVSSYTPTELSNPSDRLVALRGIVNVIHAQQDIPDVYYAAGMWSKDLPAMMIWHRVRDFEMVEEECAARRTLLHHFPSWSWASCKSSVSKISLHDGYQELISVESMRGSDDKARTIASAELILHGWTDTVKPALLTRIGNSNPLSRVLEITISGQRAHEYISWDAPPDHTSEPWYFLPVISDEYDFQGLVLQRIATKDAIPTFSRLGDYQSKLDPVLGVTFKELEKGEDWGAKLLLAPLIRLV
jgi:hypothetical protein